MSDITHSNDTLKKALTFLSPDEMSALYSRIQDGFSVYRRSRHTSGEGQASRFDPLVVLGTAGLCPARAYLADEGSTDELVQALQRAHRIVIARGDVSEPLDLTRQLQELLFGSEPLNKSERLMFLMAVSEMVRSQISNLAWKLVGSQTIDKVDTSASLTQLSGGSDEPTAIAAPISDPPISSDISFHPRVERTTDEFAKRHPDLTLQRLSILAQLQEVEPMQANIFSLIEFAGVSENHVADLFDRSEAEVIDLRLKSEIKVYLPEIIMSKRVQS